MNLLKSLAAVSSITMISRVLGFVRDTILAPGGTKPAADLVRDFLGRPYNVTAWETWLNQATPAP